MTNHDAPTLTWTKADRAKLAMSATDLMLELHAQLSAVRGTEDTLRRLLGANIDLACTITNTIAAARKVADAPTAENQRNLDESEMHLERYARRKMRQALRLAEHATAALANASRLPTCYACDNAAVGVRDRRPEGGKLEHACKRHTDGAL